MKVFKVGYETVGTVWPNFIKQKYTYAKKKTGKICIHIHTHRICICINTYINLYIAAFVSISEWSDY